MIARRKSAPALAEKPIEFGERITALRAADRQLLKTQLELEAARAPEIERTVTAIDIEKQAVLFLAGEQPEIADTDPERLFKIRVARIAIERAIALANEHEFLARVAYAQKERARRADEWRAAIRNRVMAVLALQAANRHCLDLAKEIKAKSDISLVCEVPEAPGILLGPGAVLDGPTAACLRDAISAGVITAAEIDRARIKFLEDCRK